MINKKIIYFLIFLISILFITFFIKYFSDFYLMNEVIIPEVKIKNGGIQKKTRSKKQVIYYNDKNSIKKSDIKLKKNIRYDQYVKRYMKLSGRVDFSNINFNSDQYRTVIIEVTANKNNNVNRSFFMLPINKENRFTGYIYFEKKGLNKVSCFLFYDYLSNYGRKNMNFTKKTTASIGFYVNVLDEVPDNLVYLLPSRNVDCGNKKLRKLAFKLTKDCTSDFDKAKKIYEYLVFGEDKNNNKYKFKKYKDTYNVYNGNNFYNAYTASQILDSKLGICNDFAEVYAAMMRSLNFKIKKVSGFIDENKKVGHMWNIINLNGDEKEWLKVDASWGNINKINYRKWAQYYPEFDDNFFEESFSPYNHSAFSFERKVEY